MSAFNSLSHRIVQVPLTTGKRARQDPERNEGSRPDEHDDDSQSTTSVLGKVSGNDSTRNGAAVGNDGDPAHVFLKE